MMVHKVQCLICSYCIFSYVFVRYTVDKISSLLQLMIQSDGKTYHYQTYLIKRILLKSHVALVFLFQRYLT